MASGSGKATLVLGPRHFGVVYVPEFVGASGGDLPAIESSPLVIGPRHTDGVVYMPVYSAALAGNEFPDPGEFSLELVVILTHTYPQETLLVKL